MKFSKTVSRQPRKRRSEAFAAPLHARKSLIHAHLGRELREKFGTRNMAVRKGDRVKILRGKYAGVSGKVVKVDLSDGAIEVEGVVVKKQGGKETFVAIRPSIVVITETERKAEKGAGAKAGKPAAEKKTA